jgi:hypothetical protein
VSIVSYGSGRADVRVASFGRVSAAAGHGSGSAGVRWRTLLSGLAVAAALGVAVGYLLWGRASGTDPFAIPPPTEPPGEYLYLDSARVATYLSQVEDGLTSNEALTLSRTDSVGGNVSAGGIGVQGTTQSQRSLQETVTPTDASLFYRFEARLRSHDWLHTVNATPRNFAEFKLALSSLDEGSFVLIHNCRLVLPAYAAAYRAFKQQVPTLPLTLDVAAPSGEKDFELLFPVAFSALANEPSLFSTRLTLVGKIIRQVDDAHPRYVDAETRASFDFDLAHAGSRLRRTPLTGSRSKLERAFSVAVTVNTPGAVILPIAIIK